MSDEQEKSTADEAPDAPDFAGLPAFSPRKLRRQFAFDALLRGGIVAMILIGILCMAITPELGPVATTVAMIAIVGAWLWTSSINAQVTGQLDHLLMLLDHDIAAAEDALGKLLAKRGLLRWVRLVLYQRMALLRHRQQRFGEAAAIARQVLARPLGHAESVRSNLILLMVEADLKTGQMLGAYLGLCSLAAMPLTLIEQLQRLALQTQYEVSLGYDRAALHDAQRKIAMAELMPPAQCGTWHATLAIAAQRSEQHDFADWLRRRAQLLSGPQQQQTNIAGIGEPA